MTREEYISILKGYIDHLEYMKKNADEFFDREQADEDIEAFKAAIKALEQEPYEDVIDRAEAMTEIMMFAGNVKSDEEDIYIKVSDAVQLLRELPPVNPQPKTGHWIHFAASDDCSECGWSTGKYNSPSKYCPNCGIKMIDVPDTNIGKMSEVPTGSEGSNKVNCDKTECYNCVNHGYCDYEPQESEDR